MIEKNVTLANVSTYLVLLLAALASVATSGFEGSYEAAGTTRVDNVPWNDEVIDVDVVFTAERRVFEMFGESSFELSVHVTDGMGEVTVSNRESQVVHGSGPWTPKETIGRPVYPPQEGTLLDSMFRITGPWADYLPLDSSADCEEQRCELRVPLRLESSSGDVETATILASASAYFEGVYDGGLGDDTEAVGLTLSIEIIGAP